MMTDETAKLLLAKADTFADRQDAIRAAINSGMPLWQIEECLDWIDSVRETQNAEFASCGGLRLSPGHDASGSD